MKAEKTMENAGIKPTSNRILVAKALSESEKPMSLQELEDTIDSIDKSGIFRTLKLFEANHLVHAIEDGSGSVRYEMCRSSRSHDGDHDDDLHPHFYCEKCHRTFCLHETTLPPIATPGGFVTKTINCVVKGICKDCNH